MTTPGDPHVAHDLEAVRGVLHARRTELLALPHVVGVGVGRPDPTGPYVISVMTDREVPHPPITTVDGVPLVWTVTGTPHLQRDP